MRLCLGQPHTTTIRYPDGEAAAGEEATNDGLTGGWRLGPASGRAPGRAIAIARAAAIEPAVRSRSPQSNYRY